MDRQSLRPYWFHRGRFYRFDAYSARGQKRQRQSGTSRHVRERFDRPLLADAPKLLGGEAPRTRGLAKNLQLRIEQRRPVKLGHLHEVHLRERHPFPQHSRHLVFCSVFIRKQVPLRHQQLYTAHNSRLHRRRSSRLHRKNAQVNYKLTNKPDEAFFCFFFWFFSQEW